MKFTLKFFLLLSISLNFIFANRCEIISDDSFTSARYTKNTFLTDYEVIDEDIIKIGVSFYKKIQENSKFVIVADGNSKEGYIFDNRDNRIVYLMKQDCSKKLICQQDISNPDKLLACSSSYPLQNGFIEKNFIIFVGARYDLIQCQENEVFDPATKQCNTCNNIIRGSVFSFGKCVCPVGQFEEENTNQCLSCDLVNKDNYTLKVAEQCFCKGAGFKRDDISKIANAVSNCERFVTIGDKTLSVNYIFKDGKGYAGVTGFFCNGETGPDFNFVVPAPEKCAPPTPEPDPEPTPDPNKPNPDPTPDPNKPDPNKPNPDPTPDPNKPDPNTPPVPKPDDNGSKPNDDNSNNKKLTVFFNDSRIVQSIEKTNEILANDSIHIEKIKDRLDDLLDSNDHKDFDKKDLDLHTKDGENILKQLSDGITEIKKSTETTIKDIKNEGLKFKSSLDNAISKLKNPLGGSISNYKTCNCLYSKPLNLGFKTIKVDINPCEMICKINSVTYLVFYVIFFYIFLRFIIFALFKIF